MSATKRKKTNPLSERVKVQLTVSQRLALEQKADAAGVTLTAFIRDAALVALGGADAPKLPTAKRKRQQQLVFAEIHELAVQMRKLGTNLNQLAHQANAGLVPIRRSELVYLMNRIQVVLSESSAVMERAF